MAKIVKVIVTTDKRGNGTEESPVRRIPQLFTQDGKLICEIDEHITDVTHKGVVIPTVLWDLMNM